MPERILAAITPYVPGSVIVAALLGLSWAQARAAEAAAAPDLPPGLDSLTLPAALVLAAWLVRGTAVSVTVRHVHAVDHETVRPLADRVCEEARYLMRLAKDDEITAERRKG